MSAPPADPAAGFAPTTAPAGGAGPPALGDARARAALGSDADPTDVRAALAAALGVGLLGDLLVRGGPLGLGLVAWAACAIGALLFVARRRGRPVTVAAALLAGLALAFAACLAWRDAGTLAALALVGLVTTAAALARALRDGAAWAFEHAEAGAYAAGAWAVAQEAAAGVCAFGGGSTLRGWGVEAAPVRALGVWLRGALLAAPVLTVFGLLLAAADGAFARLLSRALAVDIAALAGHAVWTAAGAWAAAGYAAGALFAKAPAEGDPPGASAAAPVSRRFGLQIGPAEVCVALACVDLLLLAFVFVQLGWVFGARALVGGPELTHASYARRGFFELAAVAAMALPLLVVAATRVARARPGPRTRRAFRAAAGLLLGLLGALVASAGDRMRLYQAAYGLTELRVYVIAFLTWLLVVFAWAAATLVRGRPAPFALGAAVLAWAWVLGLHAVDPAALVVGVNAGRAGAGSASPAAREPDARGLDVAYLASLGADAVPGLVARVVPRAAAMDAAARCAVARHLGPSLARAEAADSGGWRHWNWSRVRAARAARAARNMPAARSPAAGAASCATLDAPRPRRGYR